MSDEAHEAIEVTEEQADELALAFWHAMGEHSADNNPMPTTLDEESRERVVSPERARAMSDSVHDVLLRRAGVLSLAVSNKIRGERDYEQVCVLVVPEWFANDEWGKWQSVWLGKLKGQTQSGQAWKIEHLVPWSQRDEEEYFLDAVEFSTVPCSISTVFVGTRSDVAQGIVLDRGLDSSEMVCRERDPRDADVTFSGVKHTQYGDKLLIDFAAPWDDEDEHEAIKDVLGGFDWDRSHATFDGDDWTMDPGYVAEAIERLTQRGFTVGLTDSVRDYIESETLDRVVDEFARDWGVEL